jgi:hypothetical protein
MTRLAARALLAALAASSMTACAQHSPAALQRGAVAADASGLFSPKLPEDRALTPEEREGDFDRFLAVAKKDAVRWQPNAVLSGAQAVNVDAQGRKNGGTSYTYTFTAGRHAVNVAIAGNAVSFEKAKAAPPMDTAGLVPAAKAMEAALATKTLGGESFVLLLAQPKGVAAPVYQVAEMKKDGARVLVNARTGEAVVAGQPQVK